MRSGGHVRVPEGYRLAWSGGDSGQWLWNRYDRFDLPGVNRVEILDCIHATGHIWDIAPTLSGGRPINIHAWAEPLCTKLTLRQAKAYLAEHAAAGRMDYLAFMATWWPIASGLVEAGCQSVSASAPRAPGCAGAASALKRSSTSVASGSPLHAGLSSSPLALAGSVLPCTPSGRKFQDAPPDPTKLQRTPEETDAESTDRATVSRSSRARLLTVLWPGWVSREWSRPSRARHSAAKRRTTRPAPCADRERSPGHRLVLGPRGRRTARAITPTTPPHG